MDVSNIERSIEEALCCGKETVIEEVMRIVFEIIMKLERSEFLKDSEVKNKANGFYSRMARSITNHFRLRIPRDHLGLFRSVFMESLKEFDE